ncbi:hypothetical protein AVEN_33559-1 [Araneus ventricosus]|uniref:Uncharacterized protein n=1 Tax=Araneus ventricosus TaxID=182803 RepID=A0A4Y2MGX8_ARAVE|nr:hypothetical protein AVEN_33559-1 [Araneus ventricosus]
MYYRNLSSPVLAELVEWYRRLSTNRYVVAIICNEFARPACGKFAASSFHGDFEAFVNLLQACTLVMTNLWHACCKLKLLSGM